jgi:hypothetical protein
LITTIKHPVMAGRETSVRQALETPDEIRQSRTAAQVLLFYRADGTRRWVCAVARRAPDHAFLVTADPTDAIQRRSAGVAEVSVMYDRQGQTLTVWFSDRHQEHICEETGDEVVLMKDSAGRVIGFEKLNFTIPETDRLRIALETMPT